MSLPNIPGMPSLPTSLPFSYCVSVPLADNICSSVTDAVPSEVECAPNKVNKVGITVAKGPNLKIKDGEIEGEVSWDINIWIGFSNECVYVGTDGACAPAGCYSWPQPAVDDSIRSIAEKVADIATDIVDTIDRELPIDLPTIVKTFLIIIVAVIIAILLAGATIKPPTGAPV